MVSSEDQKKSCRVLGSGWVKKGEEGGKPFSWKLCIGQGFQVRELPNEKKKEIFPKNMEGCVPREDL